MNPCFLVILAVSTLAFADTPSGHELSLREALDLAQESSPDLKAAGAREMQAEKGIGIAQAGYYPTLDAQAIDSTGFPGSTGYLGIGGIMGSPFRSGLGAGVVLTAPIFDFGRTANRVESFQHRTEGQKQDTEVTRYRVNQEVIRAFFACSLDRSQKETWQKLGDDAEVVEREVSRFVRTGQRSIVDRYLAQTQEQEARTSESDYGTREKESEKRLSILVNIPARRTSLICPALPADEGSSEDFGLSSRAPVNPLIARAQADLQSSQALLRAARDENLPTLVGLGSAGYLQDTRLVNRADYSVGAGISIPLFDGFRITDEVDRTSAEVQEKDFSLQADQQLLDALNQQYDETILSSADRLTHLDPELQLASDAFTLAKKRYFALQGDLLDVRASLADLTRVLLDENTTRARYFEAKELKEVLNGAK